METIMASYQIGMIGFFIVLAIAVYLSYRKTAKSQKSPGELVQALEQQFQKIKESGETEPVAVIGYHKGRPLIVGVNDRRVLVLKGDGALHQAPYDDEGEHLPAAEKDKQRRGYFDWAHEDGAGYYPRVKAGPFKGQEFLLPVEVAGYPQQRDNLHEFASRFYFAWFYG
jgi:hypothetical protein